MKQTYFQKFKSLHFKNKTFSLIVMFLFGFGIIPVNGQETLNSSAGLASNLDGSINYSVGQVFYNILESSDGSVHQGIQYAIQLESLSAPENTFKLSVKAFPNPSTSELNLQIAKLNDTNLSYQIFDLLGRPVKSSTISEEKTIINIEDLPNAMYHLHVYLNNQSLIKSFKIIKN
ncbi:T9SS type A sorting domain-containing protein [Yeosuana sp. AK3]